MPHESSVRRVVIRREPDDPLALRASVGGQPGAGYYLVHRGDPDAIVAMLRDVLAAAEDYAAREPKRPQG